jgi:hypothetical protein
MSFDDDVQLTCLVRSCVVPSEKAPVAVSCTVEPLAIEGFEGVTVIAVSTALVTVTMAVPDSSPSVAVIVAVPAALPITKPWLPGALLTVANGAEEAQVTDVVRFWVVWSE